MRIRPPGGSAKFSLNCVSGLLRGHHDNRISAEVSPRNLKCASQPLRYKESDWQDVFPLSEASCIEKEIDGRESFKDPLAKLLGGMTATPRRPVPLLQRYFPRPAGGRLTRFTSVNAELYGVKM